MVVDRELVLRRLHRLDGYLKALHKHSGRSLKEYLLDEDLQAIVERRLHLALEAVLDIGNHIISADGLGTPEHYADVARILGQAGVISEDLALRLEQAAKFRNILVHGYADLQGERVYAHWQQGMSDLSAFAEAVMKYVEEV